MHFVLIGLMIIFVLVASWYDLRWGIGILASMVGIVVLLVVVSGLNIFRGYSELKPETAHVEFFDASKAYVGVWKIQARLKNNSDKQSISGVVLRVRALDCPGEDSAVDDCVIIAEASERIDVTVPTSQARDFQFTTNVKDLQPRGTLNWQLEPERLIAD